MPKAPISPEAREEKEEGHPSFPSLSLLPFVQNCPTTTFHHGAPSTIALFLQSKFPHLTEKGH
jgi:hypothetical protein